jgi:hypothetical protein
MIIKKNNLISSERDIKTSGVYIGYLILKVLKNKEKISVFDIYLEIKKKNSIFNYSSTMQGLIFLYINGLIDFSEPYIYKL